MLAVAILLPSLHNLPSAAAQTTDDRINQGSTRDQWTTAPGESLASLAHALYPDEPAAREAFSRFVRRNNPAVFDALEGDDLETAEFPPGTQLITPTPSQVVIAVSRMSAPRATRGLPEQTQPETQVTTGSAELDETVVSVDTQLERRSQLIRGIEQSVATQEALEERLQLLEELQDTLQVQLTLEGTAPVTAPIPAPAQAVQRDAPAVPSESSDEAGHDWQSWLLLLATGLLGILLIRRLTAASPHSDPSVPNHSTAPSLTGQYKATTTGSDEDSGPAYELHPAFTPPPTPESEAEKHEAALELAEIMESFGRTHGAAETLADYVETHPRQSVAPWLKLLTLHFKTGRRDEFERLADELNHTFNVRVITWENFHELHEGDDDLESFPHITRALTTQWRTRGCQAYIERLLRDNREGTREGLPLGIIDDLLLLSGILEREIGRYRPDE